MRSVFGAHPSLHVQFRNFEWTKVCKFYRGRSPTEQKNFFKQPAGVRYTFPASIKISCSIHIFKSPRANKKPPRAGRLRSAIHPAVFTVSAPLLQSGHGVLYYIE